MTNLSDLFPAGGGKQVSFVADGAISAAGKPVILNSAGTVSPISETTTTQVIPATGSNKVLYWSTGTETGQKYSSGMSAHPTDTTKTIVTYTSTADGYARVMVRSDTTLTAGTAVQFETTNEALYQQVACGKVSGQFLVYYKDGASGYPTAVVGTISGSDCSFGTPLVVTSTDRAYLSAAADTLTDNKYIVTHINASGQTTAYVATVSGTTVSVGSTQALTLPTYHEHVDCFFNPNVAGAFAVVAMTGSGSYPAINQCTYSGTTVSASTIYCALSDPGEDARGAYDATSGNLVIAYRNRLTPFYGVVRVIEADGTINAAVVTSSSALTSQTLCTDVASDPDVTTRFSVITNALGTVNTRGFYTSGTSGSMTCTLDAAVQQVTGAASTQDVRLDYCYETSKFMALWVDGASEASNGTVQVFQGAGSAVTNLTSTNFIGISDAAISDTASGNVTIKGGVAAAGLSGLTIGSDYYVQGDGTFATSAGTPSVKAGLAISAASLILNGAT
jgi:hypothetical protein